MLKFAIVAILAGLSCATSATAQTTTCGSTKLSCLLPAAFHTNPPTFNFFNEAFGTQIGQLPLATPASGFLFTFDKLKGVYRDSQESFGPLVAERPETIGRHKLYVAFTYQRFGFSELDGNPLNNLPLLFVFSSGSIPQVVTSTHNRVDAKVDQVVAFATLGITRRIDVSVAVPFEKVSLGASAAGTEYGVTNTAKASFTEFLAGSANGVGDVVISAKGTLLQHERLGLAVGGEFRLPTGDERNFLGSGAFGVKPYFVVASRGRVGPHLNLGYQWNTKSYLATDQKGKESLPGSFNYAAGTDIGLTKRLTVVADWVGQLYFDAPHISAPRNIASAVNNQAFSFPSVVLVNGFYQINSLAAGIKANPVGHLLMTANVTVKMGGGGLRANVVPLAGISYSFSDLELGIFRRLGQKCPCPKN